VEFAHAVLAKLGIYTPDALAAWYRLFGAQDASAFFELAAVVPQ
jgi:hypothetical protein